MPRGPSRADRGLGRSEEHTPELQSQSNLVFPLIFLNDTPTPEIFPLPLPAALPILAVEVLKDHADAPAQCHGVPVAQIAALVDRKSTRLNSSHSQISYSLLFF